MKQLVILAGGKGTRLQAQLGDLPKPMLPLGGKPLLEHQIALAARHGFDEVLLLTGFRSQAIEDYFGDGSRWKIRIKYCVDETPLGTAGAVLAGFPLLGERIVVMYGDTMLDVDLDCLLEFHASHQSQVTLFVHPNDHPHDSDLVEIDSQQRIVALHAYPHDPRRNYQNLVNAALYVVERDAIEPWSHAPAKLDFAKQLFPEMLRRGTRMAAYKSTEYIKDMGTPERDARVAADLATGAIARRKRTERLPAVFLDRDGTLNEEAGRICHPDRLRLIPGSAEAVARFNRAGYLVTVVTNQPVVARGDCSEEQLRSIHDKLETLLGFEGAYLDQIYYCPHHPDRGFAGERGDLKIDCACRKPNTGLIEQALAELPIERQASWFIGDTTTDVQTAANAGLRSILLETGHAGRDGNFSCQADFVLPDLLAAAQFILSESPLSPAMRVIASAPKHNG